MFLIIQRNYSHLVIVVNCLINVLFGRDTFKCANGEFIIIEVIVYSWFMGRYLEPFVLSPLNVLLMYMYILNKKM